MNISFNQLTPAQAERLALLMEEMGEAQQAIGKILRHGYESHHPNDGPSNRQSLERELGDVVCAIDLLSFHEDLDPESIVECAKSKAERVVVYLHHQ